MAWNPKKYTKFKKERFQPFDDLINLVDIRPGMKVVDLGCGTGELTRRLFDLIPDGEVLGIDSSVEMLGESEQFGCPGLQFKHKSIEEVGGSWDLVFSHAALHWINEHDKLIPKLLSLLMPGGQLAVQIPSNHHHISQKLIVKVAQEEPFCKELNNWVRISPVLTIDEYAQLLYKFGGKKITVFEKVYPHLLLDVDALVDWISSTTMVPYFERLPKELHQAFVNRYREELLNNLPDGEVFYPFRRTLFVATI